MRGGQRLMKHSVKFFEAYAVGVVFLAVAILLGIALGSTQMTISELWQAITGGAVTEAGARIFWYVRFPRTLACIVCGAALAVSGAVIQGTLANKLASPSIIGVNSGAGLAVTLCTTFGIYGGWKLSLYAFLGAFVSVLLVSMGAKKWGASRSTVILMGVALNSLLNALSDTIITFFPEVGVMSNDFKVGEFSAVTYQKLLPAVVIVGVALVVLLTLTNEVDILQMGEENAKGLGMNTKVIRTLFLILSALLAGCAVSLAGLLSFVGLIVPHVIRRIAGNKASHLLPLCAIYGAGFVTLCDTLARTLFSPYEIPVGIIMAFIGVPFFVCFLVNR